MSSLYHPPDHHHLPEECPKCHFTMELLRESALLERDYSVSLDSGSWIRGVRGGSFAWLFDWLFSERDNKKRELIVAEYPESLICPHCEYIIERK